MLNEWAIAWVAHELPRDPTRVFDANIFYPERHTLAYSEAMIVQSVLATPLFALGASPVLAYNLVLLAGFVFTGWATCLVIARWTGDWLAGTTAGSIAAFNAHTLTRLPHLQAQHVEFLPLALLALDALLRRPRWRWAALLAIFFVLQALTSMYLLVFTAVALAFGFIVRPEDWLGRRAIDVLPKIALAAIGAAILLLPVLLPYWDLRTAGLARSLDEAGYFAASARDYITSPARLHTWMTGAFALFPGVLTLLLAGIAIATGRAFTDARARMCLAFGAVGVLLSFGPALAPGYEFFSTTIPLFQGIRTSSRFGYLGIFALAMLAGFGAALLRGRLQRVSAPLAAGVAVAIVALTVADSFAGPIEYVRFDGIPSIYTMPAANAAAIVAELPLAPPEYQFRDATAVLHSTANWRPLLNGYSGQTPPGYIQRYIAMNHFPDPASVDALRAAGVNTLFVHTDKYDRGALDAMARTPGLTRIAAQGNVVLFSLGAGR